MVAVAAGTDRPTRTRRRLPSWTGGLFGVVGVLVLWQVAGLTVFHSSGTVPPPTKILSQMRADGWSFYWANASVTMHEALIGWLWGNGLAIVLALSFLVVPVVERPLMRL